MKYVECDRCGKRIEKYYELKIELLEKEQVNVPHVVETSIKDIYSTTTVDILPSYRLSIHLVLCGKCKDEILKEPIEKIKEEYK